MNRGCDPLINLDTMVKTAGHEKWGWHIHRCTYSSDDDWLKFMKQLKPISQRMIEGHGATYDAQAKETDLDCRGRPRETREHN